MGLLDGINLGKYLPDFSGLGSSLLYFFIGFLFLVALTYVGYVVWDNKRYRYKIEIFENLGGTRYVKTGVDKARLVKIDEQGAEVLMLKARKKIIMAYGRKMGNNLMWFAIGQDGIWYNITLGDLDSKQGMLDIEPVDRDMRYAHVAVRKNIQDRYNKPKFMDKYGSLIMQGIFLIIIIIGIGYLLNKMADVASALVDAIRMAKETGELNKMVLSALDNLCSGSGIKVT